MRAGWRALAFLFACLLAEPASGLTVLNRGNGAEIKSLDPHFIDGLNESNVEGDLLMLTIDTPVSKECNDRAHEHDACDNERTNGNRIEMDGTDVNLPVGTVTLRSRNSPTQRKRQ